MNVEEIYTNWNIHISAVTTSTIARYTVLSTQTRNVMLIKTVAVRMYTTVSRTTVQRQRMKTVDHDVHTSSLLCVQWSVAVEPNSPRDSRPISPDAFPAKTIQLESPLSHRLHLWPVTTGTHKMWSHIGIWWTGEEQYATVACCKSVTQLSCLATPDTLAETICRQMTTDRSVLHWSIAVCSWQLTHAWQWQIGTGSRSWSVYASGGSLARSNMIATDRHEWHSQRGHAGAGLCGSWAACSIKFWCNITNIQNADSAGVLCDIWAQ